jgi:dihydroflavonol-4-reductase
MLNMLNACKQHKVEKLIVTASVATMVGSAWRGTKDPIYDENDFAIDHKQYWDGYIESKIMQEQEIIKWNKYQQEHPDEHQIEIITIHPSFILGPPLNHLASSSVEGFRKICTGKLPMVPQIQAGNIDVRHCAEAHIKALKFEAGKLHGERFVISQESYWMLEQCRMIRDHFHDKGLAKVTNKEAGKKTLQLIALADPSVKMFIPRVGIPVNLNNQKSKDILGMQYETPIKQTLIDMVNAMLEHKIIELDSAKPGGCGCTTF